jgi:DNA-directed RNA polymerase specialized sigma24 family protein
MPASLPCPAAVRGAGSTNVSKGKELKKINGVRVVESVHEDSTPHRAPIESLGELYRSSYHRYLRVAEAITGDVEVAQEAVQDAFARAIRGRFEDRGAGSLEGWVWRTVVNTARNVRRDRPPSSLPLDELGDASASCNGDVPGGDVRTLITALPERQRLVLFLRHYADLDYARIADVLEIKPGTVGATLTQAHAALRTALEEVPT